jgi:hypothetical protein
MIWWLILILILMLMLAGCATVSKDVIRVGDGEAQLMVDVSPGDHTIQASPENATEVAPRIIEARKLVLEWSPKIRVGEQGVVHLTLDVDEPGNLTPTADIAGHTDQGEIVFSPNIYDTHRVIAAARLDIAALHIAPNNLIEQPLLPGERVDYYWGVTANEVSTIRGTVWLYLRLLPLSGGNEIQRPLTAQVIEIKSVSLLGLGSKQARVLGSIGIVVGGLLGMDDILTLFKRGYHFIKKGA